MYKRAYGPTPGPGWSGMHRKKQTGKTEPSLSDSLRQQQWRAVREAVDEMRRTGRAPKWFLTAYPRLAGYLAEDTFRELALAERLSPAATKVPSWDAWIKLQHQPHPEQPTHSVSGVKIHDKPKYTFLERLGGLLTGGLPSEHDSLYDPKWQRRWRAYDPAPLVQRLRALYRDAPQLLPPFEPERLKWFYDMPQPDRKLHPFLGYWRKQDRDGIPGVPSFPPFVPGKGAETIVGRIGLEGLEGLYRQRLEQLRGAKFNPLEHPRYIHPWSLGVPALPEAKPVRFRQSQPEGQEKKGSGPDETTTFLPDEVPELPDVPEFPVPTLPRSPRRTGTSGLPPIHIGPDIPRDESAEGAFRLPDETKPAPPAVGGNEYVPGMDDELRSQITEMDADELLAEVPSWYERLWAKAKPYAPYAAGGLAALTAGLLAYYLWKKMRDSDEEREDVLDRSFAAASA